MKKLVISLLAILLLSMTVLGVANAETDAKEQMDKPAVELSEKQQKKLAKLHQQIFKKKKKLIDKYVEYGVITKEKGDKIIAHMEKHMRELEKNGYIPDCKYKHKKRLNEDQQDRGQTP